jgi:L-serine dehydratase
MYSIKSVYKIGHGPSSSHTMGPANAAKFFSKKYPNATSYKVTLYGSLALTGKGHLTDKAIINTFAPKKVEIVWNAKDTSIEHPNTMDLVAYHQDKMLGALRIYSIGGGAFTIKGEPANKREVDVYKLKTATQILDICKKNK